MFSWKDLFSGNKRNSADHGLAVHALGGLPTKSFF